MQENLGITIIKVALLVLILFMLTLNTCQMTSIEERYGEVQNKLMDVNTALVKLEDRVDRLSERPVNVNLNMGNGVASNGKTDLHPEFLKEIPSENNTGDQNNTQPNETNEDIDNPLSLISLKDYAFYNQPVVTEMIEILKKQNPDKYKEIDYTPKFYSDFSYLLDEYPELVSMIKDEVRKQIDTPMKAESVIVLDNRERLIASNANYNSHFNMAYFDDPKTFNPLTSSEAQFSRLITWVNNGLCMRDPKEPDNHIGLLAKKVTITDDYKCYTFWLRKGVKWNKPQLDSSDPRFDWLRNADKEVTAEDFKFTLDMIYNPAVECDHTRSYYTDVDGSKMARINIINRYLFQMIWKKKTYQSKVFSIDFTAWPKHIYGYDELGNAYDEASIGKMFNEHWLAKQGNIVGCGPYILTRYRKAEEMQFVRNENYYSVLPPVKKLTCRILSDDQLTYRTFKEGRIDVDSMDPTDWKKDIRDNDDPNSDFNNGNIINEEYTGNSYNYIGWNNERVFFTDPKVRRAMTHAFNRQELVKNVYYNLATVVTGNFWNESPEYDKSIKPYEFDLQKASELLDEAGWTIKEGNTLRSKIIDDKEVFFSFVMVIIDGRDEYLTSAKIFSEDLKQIGVEMTPKPTKWPALLKLLDDSNFDAVVLGWALSYEADPWQIWHSSEAAKPGSSNHIKFRSAEADRIIEKLRVTFDKEERIKLCHKFHKLMHELQPYTFFVSRKTVAVKWKWVKNHNPGALYPRSYKFPLHTLNSE